MREMHYRRNYTCAGGDGHTYEILLARAPGIGRLWVHSNIETGKTACASYQKKKTRDCAQPRKQARHVGSGNFSGNFMKSPGPREQSRRNPKSDDIGQRIQLAAKIAGSSGHARNTTVEAIKQNCKTNGFGGGVEMPKLQRGILGRLRG